MTNDISVNKQTVLQYLASGQEVPFLIPEYQRLYSWSYDKITTLFDDLWDFSIERLQEGGASSYFLSSVVSYWSRKRMKNRFGTRAYQIGTLPSTMQINLHI